MVLTTIVGGAVDGFNDGMVSKAEGIVDGILGVIVGNTFGFDT